MSYQYTVEDRMERFAMEIWEASKTEDFNKLQECIAGLKNLKLVATQRSEFAKAAIQGLAARPPVSEKGLAFDAFAIADAMLEMEQKKT